MPKVSKSTPGVSRSRINEPGLTPRNNNPKSPAGGRTKKVTEVKYHVKRQK